MGFNSAFKGLNVQLQSQRVKQLAVSKHQNSRTQITAALRMLAVVSSQDTGTRNTEHCATRFWQRIN